MAEVKLPGFAEDSGHVNDTIVNDTNSYNKTGFQANELIVANDVNTYIKMCVNAVKAFAMTIKDDTINLNASNTYDAWSNFVSTSLKKYVKETKADNAIAANYLDQTVTGDISDAVPCYWDKQSKQVLPCANSLNRNINGNAATATKLQTARTISLSGNAQGSASFNGANDVSLNVNSVKAKSVEQTNVGSQNGIYINSNGTFSALNSVKYSAKANYLNVSGGISSGNYANVEASLDDATETKNSAFNDVLPVVLSYDSSASVSKFTLQRPTASPVAGKLWKDSSSYYTEQTGQVVTITGSEMSPSDKTIGSNNLPVFLKNGVLTACSRSAGFNLQQMTAVTPTYVSAGHWRLPQLIRVSGWYYMEIEVNYSDSRIDDTFYARSVVQLTAGWMQTDVNAVCSTSEAGNGSDTMNLVSIRCKSASGNGHEIYLKATYSDGSSSSDAFIANISTFIAVRLYQIN